MKKKEQLIMKINMTYILELYSKPLEYNFSKEEIKVIYDYLKTKKLRLSYFIYTKESKLGLKLGVYINTMPSQLRSSMCENSWKVICSRELTKTELLEQAENFGSCNRRFEVFYYKDIDYLIYEDSKYNVATPEIFIKYCKNNNLGERKQLKLWEE